MMTRKKSSESCRQTIPLTFLSASVYVRVSEPLRLSCLPAEGLGKPEFAKHLEEGAGSGGNGNLLQDTGSANSSSLQLAPPHKPLRRMILTLVENVDKIKHTKGQNDCPVGRVFALHEVDPD